MSSPPTSSPYNFAVSSFLANLHEVCIFHNPIKLLCLNVKPPKRKASCLGPPSTQCINPPPARGNTRSKKAVQYTFRPSTLREPTRSTWGPGERVLNSPGFPAVTFSQRKQGWKLMKPQLALMASRDSSRERERAASSLRNTLYAYRAAMIFQQEWGD